MDTTITFNKDQVEVYASVDRDLEDTVQYIFDVGLATLEQRTKSQAKQLVRSKRARAALRYVESQGIKL